MVLGVSPMGDPALMTEATLSLTNADQILTLFGIRDQHLRKVRDNFGVSITHKDSTIRVSGDEAAVSQAAQALEQNCET